MTDENESRVMHDPNKAKKNRLAAVRIFKLKSGVTLVAMLGGIGFRMEIPYYQILHPVEIAVLSSGETQMTDWMWESSETDFLLPKDQCIVNPAVAAEILAEDYLSIMEETATNAIMNQQSTESVH